MLKNDEYFSLQMFTIYKRCAIIQTSKHYNVCIKR